MSECPLTELPAEQCACRNHRGGHTPGEEPLETVGHDFEALYPGSWCLRGDEIAVGDRIIRVFGGGYVHPRCAGGSS